MRACILSFQGTRQTRLLGALRGCFNCTSHLSLAHDGAHMHTSLYRRLHTKAHQCPGCTDLSQGLPTYIHKPKKLKLKKWARTELPRIIPFLPVFPLAMHAGLPMSSFFLAANVFHSSICAYSSVAGLLPWRWHQPSGRPQTPSSALFLCFALQAKSRYRDFSVVHEGFTSGSLFRKHLSIYQACGLLCWGGKQSWVPQETVGEIRGLNWGSWFFFMSCHFKGCLWKMGALPVIFPFFWILHFCSFPFSKILLKILNRACSVTGMVPALKILASSVEG